MHDAACRILTASGVGATVGVERTLSLDPR